MNLDLAKTHPNKISVFHTVKWFKQKIQIYSKIELEN